MRTDGQLASEFTIPKDFDSLDAAVSEPGSTQSHFIYAGSIFKTVQRLEIDRQVRGGMTCIVEAPFRDTPYQRHLTAFEADTNRAAGARRLALATASARLAVTAGFALA